MGLKEILSIRQYIDFDVDGKAFRAYEITFRTEKTEGMFTLDIRADEYTADKAKDMAAERAIEIDKAVG